MKEIAPTAKARKTLVSTSPPTGSGLVAVHVRLKPGRVLPVERLGLVGAPVAGRLGRGPATAPRDQERGAAPDRRDRGQQGDEVGGQVEPLVLGKREDVLAELGAK